MMQDWDIPLDHRQTNNPDNILGDSSQSQVYLELMTPLFGCYWRNRNNSLLAFPSILNQPTLDYVRHKETNSKKASNTVSGDKLKVLVRVPPELDHRNVYITAWMRPVCDLGKPLIGTPLAISPLISSSSSTLTDNSVVVSLRPRRKDKPGKMDCWKYDGPVGNTRDKSSYTHPLRIQPSSGSTPIVHQFENMIAVEIAIFYSTTEDLFGPTSVEIARIQSTGFFVGSTRNLRNGVNARNAAKDKLLAEEAAKIDQAKTDQEKAPLLVLSDSSAASSSSIDFQNIGMLSSSSSNSTNVTRDMNDTNNGNSSGSTLPLNELERPAKKQRHDNKEQQEQQEQPEQPQQPQQPQQPASSETSELALPPNESIVTLNENESHRSAPLLMEKDNHMSSSPSPLLPLPQDDDEKSEDSFDSFDDEVDGQRTLSIDRTEKDVTSFPKSYPNARLSSVALNQSLLTEPLLSSSKSTFACNSNQMKNVQKFGRCRYKQQHYASNSLGPFPSPLNKNASNTEILDLFTSAVPDMYTLMAKRRIPHYQEIARTTIKSTGYGEGRSIITRGIDHILCPHPYSQVIEFRRVKNDTVELLLWNQRRVTPPGKILKYSTDPEMVKSRAGPTKPLRILFQFHVTKNGVVMNQVAFRMTGNMREIFWFFFMQVEGKRLTKFLRPEHYANAVGPVVEEIAKKKQTVSECSQLEVDNGNESTLVL